MILIDSREDSILSGAVIKLCEEQKVEYKKQWLEIGDYIMSANKTVAIEAKSSGDFLASVRNGRVFNQASNMLDNYDISVVLIYGTFGNGRVFILLIPSEPYLRSLSSSYASLLDNLNLT